MNVLAADRLMLNPKLYSTYLLWLMTEIYARLPEVGDLDLPKFVFFFDEAHMLFEDTSKALVAKIEQVIRLIRSKGVGIYFITQVPSDVPVSVLAQLSNRVQHALRAYTPQDQKAVRAAAQTFRANPAFKTEDAILDLGTGEALVSFLDEKGAECRGTRQDPFPAEPNRRHHPRSASGYPSRRTCQPQGIREVFRPGKRLRSPDRAQPAGRRGEGSRTQSP